MTFRYLQSLPAFNRRFVLVLATFILFLIMALVTMVLNPPRQERVWRIAVTDWPGYDALHLAAEKNMFAEHGLNVKLVPINAIIDMRTAFERGLIDGYTAPLVDVVESMQTTGVPARIVLALDYSNGGDQILAVPAIPSPAALGDARVGLETSSAIGRYLLGRALGDKPLHATSIRLIQGSQPQLVEMTIAGKLDAVVTYHPSTEKILARRTMHVLYSSAEIPNEIMDVLAVSPHLLAQQPDFSRKLSLVWRQALAYGAQYPSETVTIHARRYGVTPEKYARMTHGIRAITETESRDILSSGRMARAIMQAVRLLTPSSPVTADDIAAMLAIPQPEATP